MNVSVFGLGYVGCVSAACLAELGHHVIGIDLSEDKVTAVNRGRAPMIEAGLEELVSACVHSGRLSAATDATEAVAQSDVAIVCVGTPSAGQGRPDVDAVERVGYDIGRALADRSAPFTVILRSTVLPGTTERVFLPALRAGAGPQAMRIRVIVNPEFMREGSSIHDFHHPPFVVVGSADPAAVGMMRELYVGLTAPFVHTEVRTAELVKYASNTFHALKVCFANELADMCRSLGADVHEVSRLFLLDRTLNVSDAYLTPGFAFGGSCLPKDVRALMWAARSEHVEVPLLSAILPSNAHQVDAAVQVVLETGRRRIGVAGLAFKPGTDDLRDSPIVTLVETLIGKGRDVRILDAHVNVSRLVGGNRRYIETEIPHIASLLCNSAADLARHAEVLIVTRGGDETEAALQAVTPSCIVIDLTRGSATRTPVTSVVEVAAEVP